MKPSLGHYRQKGFTTSNVYKEPKDLLYHITNVLCQANMLLSRTCAKAEVAFLYETTMRSKSGRTDGHLADPNCKTMQGFRYGGYSCA